MSAQSSNQILSPVGVCVLPRPNKNGSRTTTYPDYIFEIMDSAGIFYTVETIEELAARLPKLGVLVTVGEAELPEDLAGALKAWVNDGGAWVSVAGVCGQDELLGVSAQSAAFSSFGGGMGTLGEGYLKVDQADHPVLSHLEIPLHYFNGAPLVLKDATQLGHSLDAHGRETDRKSVV